MRSRTSTGVECHPCTSVKRCRLPKPARTRHGRSGHFQQTALCFKHRVEPACRLRHTGKDIFGFIAIHQHTLASLLLCLLPLAILPHLCPQCGLPERLAISYQKFGRTRKNWRIRSASRFTRLSRGKADTCEIPPFLLLVWLYRPIYPCGQTFGRLRPNFRVIRNFQKSNYWPRRPSYPVSHKNHRMIFNRSGTIPLMPTRVGPARSRCLDRTFNRSGAIPLMATW